MGDKTVNFGSQHNAEGATGIQAAEVGHVGDVHHHAPGDPWESAAMLVKCEIPEPDQPEILAAINELEELAGDENVAESALQGTMDVLKPHAKMLGRAVMAAVKTTPLGLAGAAGAAFVYECLK